MKVELTDISECKKSLDFEVPQDVVDHELGHIAQEFAPFLQRPVAGHDGGPVFIPAHDHFKKMFA